MSYGIGTVHIRMQRGELVVQGDGQTPRGQRYIKRTVELGVPSMASPGFKSALAAKVNELLAQQVLPL